MAYQMRRPSSHRARSPKPVLATSAGVALAVDPGRQQIVIAAFIEMYGRLEGLLHHGWAGALEELEQLSPAHGAALDTAESRADELALAFTKRTADEDEFLAALRAYEAEWARAARFLRSIRLGPGRQPCRGCGRENATVTVVQDDGTRLCARCHREGGPCVR